MLTSFERDMISIIRAAIVGTEPNISENFDFDLAYGFSQKMQIAPLVCCGIEKLPNAFLDTGSKKFLKSTISYSFYCDFQDKEIESILGEFDKQQIEYLRLKGTDIKRLYPRSELRLMSDADILIKKKQYKKIKAIMLSLGYKAVTESDHEYIWQKNGINIELHKRLIPSYNKDYYNYFGDGWRLAKPREDKPNEYVMSNEDNFIYLFTHYAKHYRDSGIGVKHLTDFYVFLNENKNLDWNYVNEELKVLQLYDFWQTTKNVLDVLFKNAECDEKSAFVIRRIFDGAAYGSYENHVLSDGVKASKSTKNARMKKIWEGIFPSFSLLKIKHKFLKWLPFLLPLVWLCHWVKTIFNPKKLARKRKELNTISSENIKTYQDELNYVGLDFNFK